MRNASCGLTSTRAAEVQAVREAVKILFLDIDGVLNAHDWNDEAQSSGIRRDCVAHLNHVIRETECKIVLSSAWRYVVLGGDMTLKGFDYMLRTHGLICPSDSASLIVGCTVPDELPPKAMGDGKRGRQCRDWLNSPENQWKVTWFAAVDDEDDGFAELGIPAVITNGARGLTAEDADKLIGLLNRASA
jgi:hypothetical protein